MSRRVLSSALRASASPALLAAVLLCGACAPPPEGDALIGRAQLAIVQDTAIQKVVQVFQVHVVKATTASGASVTCGDIPGNFRPGDGQLVAVVDPPKNIPWTGGVGEARVERFPVPANQKLVLLVKGLAQYAQGVHTSAFGCQDNLIFTAGSTQELTIDVKATTGAPCNAQPECELNLICHKGSEFKGGYCAKIGCAGDQDCPPGSLCVSDPVLGGICLRRCETQRDCGTIDPQLVQECVGRVGPTAKGCAAVCVWPLWNKTNKCEAIP